MVIISGVPIFMVIISGVPIFSSPGRSLGRAIVLPPASGLALASSASALAKSLSFYV